MDERCSGLAVLAEQAAACDRCATMIGRRRVLSRVNGRPGATVMFVAEAPGRLGGDRTGVPLSSDQTGRNFTRLLGAVDWDRNDLFVTNAVLCNPRTGFGRNRAPSRTELEACRGFLEAQLELVDPKLVVALGVVALAALASIEPHSLSLRRDVRTTSAWYGRQLVPLYHPGPRAQIHRPFATQVDDFRWLHERAKGFTKISPLLSLRA